MYDQENVNRGYVYILVNPVFTRFVKIGKTTKDPHTRAREISQGTGVPAPYQVVWDALVNDYDNVERLIHEELVHYRTRNDREFFSLSPKQAIALVTRVVAPYVCEEESMAELTLASEMPMAGSLHPQDVPTGTIGSRAERTNQSVMITGAAQRRAKAEQQRREQLLSGSMNKRAVYGAIQAGELTDWNMAAAEVIAAANGLVLTVSQRQRSEGRNKASRFFQFGEELSSDRNGRTPVLKLKTANVKNPGRVSLEVQAAYDDSSLRTRATDAGFETFVTNRGTLLISATTQNLRELTIAKSVAEQIRHLEDAADVAQKLIEWWENQRGASVLLPPPEPVA